MKHFSFILPNKKVDDSARYKNYLLSRLATAYPELTIDGIDTEETPFSYQYVGPCGRIRFGNDYYSRCDVANEVHCPLATNYYAPTYNLCTQFELAMKKLDDYAKMKRNYTPLYDMLLEDGTPVREYNNFIQVGYNFIPKRGSSAYFERMNNLEKSRINNLIIVVNQITNRVEYNM